MDILFTLIINLVPLYLLIGLGYFGARFLNIDRMSLANLAIYICFPVTIFGFIVQLDLKPSYALLPVIMCTISAIVCFSVLWLGQKIYGDKRANLLCMCASMGNTGYFGLPIVLLVFPPEWVGVYMLMLLGFVIYEGTAAYYIGARGNWSPRESFIKLLKLPSIYAIAAGLLYNLSGLELSPIFLTYWGHFKGCYVVVGMMIIGSALAAIKRLEIGPRFLGITFLGKFVLWPLLTASFIWMDKSFFGLFSETIYQMMILISIVPPAANITAFATQLNLLPEKAATTILAGTVFALVYIPLILWFLGIQAP